MKAFIAGCAGTELTPRERDFFRAADPLGFILFRRNISAPEGVRRLTASLRDAVGRADAPVLVDQEGGRVQRLGPPHWPRYPAGRAFAACCGTDDDERARLVRLGARLIAHDLRDVGIDVDCLPVLDVPIPGAHDVIGDRAYGTDPATVTRLGRAAADGLLDGGVLPVMKHIPGHGRAGADSHAALPRVDASLDDLRAHDFPPFRALADLPIAMTAHVVFSALDGERPATLSPAVIDGVIRGELGFDGLLLTDDLSMKALSGSFRDRTERALAAGCDVALHCNGDLGEMEAVAAGAAILSGRARARVIAALARIAGTAVDPFDVAEARANFSSALAGAARGPTLAA